MEDNRSLICRVCHNYLKGLIRQCAKDSTHNFCKSCIEKFDECVVCGGTVPFKIDPSIERALLTQPHPCKFMENGCHTSLPLQLKTEHENECIYKIHKCEYSKFSRTGNCPWKGPYNQINTHFRSHIKSSFGNMPITVPMKIINAKSFNFIQLVRQHNEIFWYKHRIDFQKQKIFFLFQLIGTKQMASDFYYKIEIISRHDPNIKHEFTKYCLSDSEDPMDAFINENCGVLSFKQASDFITDNTISFNYYIKKKELKLENLKINQQATEQATNNSSTVENNGCQNENKKQFQQRRQWKNQGKNYRKQDHRDGPANRKRSESKSKERFQGYQVSSSNNGSQQASAPYEHSELIEPSQQSVLKPPTAPISLQQQFDQLHTRPLSQYESSLKRKEQPSYTPSVSHSFVDPLQNPLRRDPPPPYEESATREKEVTRTYKELLNEANTLSSDYSSARSYQQQPLRSSEQYRKPSRSQSTKQKDNDCAIS